MLSLSSKVDVWTEDLELGVLRRKMVIGMMIEKEKSLGKVQVRRMWGLRIGYSDHQQK